MRVIKGIIMKSFILLGAVAVSLFLTECSKITPFTDTLNQFNSDLRAIGRPALDFAGLTIEFRELPDNELGHCYYRGYSGEPKLITIDSRIIDERLRQDVIYHEIGHCYFNLNHSVDGRGIMAAQPEAFTWQRFEDQGSRLASLKEMLK